MATVNFMYRSNKEKAYLTVRLLHREDKKDLTFGAKTEIFVSMDFWKKYIKENPRLKDIDLITQQQQIKNECTKLTTYILSNTNSVNLNSVSNEWFKDLINQYYNPKKEIIIPTDLTSYIDYYLNARKHDLKPTSIGKMRTIQGKLKAFEIDRKQVIYFNEINESFKNEFVEYYNIRNYAKNTIQRELSFIKTICYHARYNGIDVNIQLDSLRVEKEKAEKIFLNTAELELIQNLELEHDYLDNARDWLIISCYTGQRISDFLKFNKEMIRKEDGVFLLEFTQKKTNKIMTIPLAEKVLNLLKKRNGEFPRQISDQRYNEYIKEVCQIAGIKESTYGGKQLVTKDGTRKVMGHYPKWELVSSHIGRRSFATNYYGKAPTSFLIYVTGHCSEVMFLAYIGKSNKDFAKEFANYL